MSGIDIQGLSYTGMYFGLGVAVVPVTFTTAIACSRIILVNIIADISMRILTANRYTLKMYGVSFVHVPFLWKASLVSAIVGGTLTAFAFLVSLTHIAYQRYATQSVKQESLN